MGSYTPVSRDPHSEDFDAVVSYLAAISRRLSPTELLDITDALHELIRRRKRQRGAPCEALSAFAQHGRHAPSPFATDRSRL